MGSDRDEQCDIKFYDTDPLIPNHPHSNQPLRYAIHQEK